jgi:NTE family protein
MTVRAMVLSGGGVKGAFQVGALRRAFDDHPDLHGDAWFGVSTGNLTAALCAQSRTRGGQYRLLGRATKIYARIQGNGDIYRGSRWWPAMAWRAVRGAALFDPAPLDALIRQHIDPMRLAAGAHFSCGTVELESGEYARFDGSSRYVHAAILASASMPVYFPPVPIAGWHYIDGGLRDQTPLKEAVTWLKDHPDPEKELWVYLASPLTLAPARGPWRRTLDVAKRSLAITLNEVYQEDLASLRAKNHRPGYATIRSTVVAPPEDFGDALDFTREKIQRMLDLGYATPTSVPHV